MSMDRSISLQEVLSVLGQEYQVVGSPDRWVSRYAPIDAADETCLTFCSRPGERGQHLLETTRSRVILCLDALDVSGYADHDKTFILVSNPRLAYAKALHRFFAPRVEYGLHSTVVIGQSVRVHPDTRIGPHVVIGDDCEIGEGTVIEANVTLYRRTRVGKRVVIHSGAVIGADGFGFERDPSGDWVNFPQLGGVIIEDDVEVGANTCIDRGALEDTIVGAGSKLDNLVHVGHNVRIGRRCILTALACMCGSVVVEDDCWIGPTASVRQGLTVGSHALVGMGAMVARDVPADMVVAGVPARVTRENT